MALEHRLSPTTPQGYYARRFRRAVLARLGNTARLNEADSRPEGVMDVDILEYRGEASYAIQGKVAVIGGEHGYRRGHGGQAARAEDVH